MGFFDYYEPKPRLKCERCDIAFDGWQGKEADCGLFVWKQGEVSPVGQEADDCNLLPEDLEKRRLPEEFLIYTDGCDDCEWIEAVCKTENERWTITELVTYENAIQWRLERKAEYKARLKRLRYRSKRN